MSGTRKVAYFMVAHRRCWTLFDQENRLPGKPTSKMLAIITRTHRFVQDVRLSAISSKAHDNIQSGKATGQTV
jgi:hypothetical protein